MDDVNFSACKFTTDIVPYMYGEMSRLEGSAFESHLLNCLACTDEFALISNARYEVYDWKKLEFDGLETPSVVIPYDESTPVNVVSAGWVEKFRAAFANPWLIPGAAFAGLAVISVLAAVFLSSSNTVPDIAAKIDNSNIAAANVPSGIGNIDDTTFAKDKNRAEDLNEPKPKLVRTNLPVIEAPRRQVRNAKLAPPRAIEAKQAATQNGSNTVPRLNGIADDEDTSLRLAELFEDIDTRE